MDHEKSSLLLTIMIRLAQTGKNTQQYNRHVGTYE